MIGTKFDLFGELALKGAEDKDEEECEKVSRSEQMVGSGLKHHFGVGLKISKKRI